MFVLCRAHMPHWLAFNAFILLPLCMASHMQPAWKPRTLIGSRLMERAAFVLSPLLINAYLMHRWDTPLWSRTAIYCRLLIGSIAGMWQAFYGDTSYAIVVRLCGGALLGLGDYLLPYVVLAAVENWSVPVALSAIFYPKV